MSSRKRAGAIRQRKGAMHRIWQQFKTPTGKKYYYNKETKESQWNKPDFKKTSDPQSSAKAPEIERKPTFALELINCWHLVICNDGTKLYYNKESGVFKTEIGGEDGAQCSALIESLNKENLILLIGVARGYSMEEEEIDRIFESLHEELDLFRKNQGEVEREEATEKEAGDVIAALQESHAGLVSGYGSSSEDEDEEKHDEQQDGNEQTSLIDDLNLIDSGSVDGRDLLFRLFDRYELDKFSTWSLQSKKIENDPDFYKIGDDAVRESLFEEWCGVQESESESDDNNAGVFEPTKYHYLAQIVAKAGPIASDTIPQDIRKHQKALYKAYRIKEYVPSKREQDRFVSQLLFYYKTFSLEQRRVIFHDCLRDHERDFAGAIGSLRQDNGLVSEWQALLQSPADGSSIEDVLLSIENRCGVAPVAETDPRYYVVGIFDKTVSWVQWLAAEGGPLGRLTPDGGEVVR